MKIQVVKLGRVAYPALRELAAMYEERTQAFAKVASLELKDVDAKSGPHRSPGPGHKLIALDERGEQWTSPEMARRLQAFIDDPGTKSLTFLVGGPMGLDEQARREATVHWSLSKATLTSDMAWLLCWEQLYRAFNIIKGTGYHHD